jgi:hypothetical protein
MNILPMKSWSLLITIKPAIQKGIKKLNASITAWFREYWDTGHKPLFYAALGHRALYVPPTEDFAHF